MCHAFLIDSSFYQSLFRMDQAIAAETQAGGCCFCGGKLHSARYPRKPQGVREALDESADYRLSFCCANDGCRCRTTPPSVRFLGRKVSLGVIVVLLGALEHGLSSKRRQWLIDTLNIPAQTLWRWQSWWRDVVARSPWWRVQRSGFVLPVTASRLPDELLGRVEGADLRERVVRLLWLIAPLSTTSWSGSLRMVADPQKM